MNSTNYHLRNWIWTNQINPKSSHSNEDNTIKMSPRIQCFGTRQKHVLNIHSNGAKMDFRKAPLHHLEWARPYYVGSTVRPSGNFTKLRISRTLIRNTFPTSYENNNKKVDSIGRCRRSYNIFFLFLRNLIHIKFLNKSRGKRSQ